MPLPKLVFFFDDIPDEILGQLGYEESSPHRPAFCM